MKRAIKFLGIITVAAVIGFSFAACEEGDWEDINEFASDICGTYNNEAGDTLIIGPRTVGWKNNEDNISWTASFVSGTYNKAIGTYNTKLKVTTAVTPNPHHYVSGYEVDFVCAKMLARVILFYGELWTKPY